MNTDNSHRYEDIIELPRHISRSHLPMAVSDRAAQFSPFAALTGYDEAIRETARLTDQKIELDESSKEILNEKLLLLAERLKEQTAAAITYFMADGKKEGGYYVTAKGKLKKIDEYEGLICFQDGNRIPLGDVIEIDIELENQDL